MAIVTKKCYYSNISKAIYFYFYSSAPADFKPVIKKSVSYIVAAVLINDQGKTSDLVFRFDKYKCIQ